MFPDSSTRPAPTDGWSNAGARILNHIHARLATMAKPAGGLAKPPESSMIGLLARGERMIAGKFLMGGGLVENQTSSVWDIPQPTLAFRRELHGFAWLDDLAAVGDSQARNTAGAWTTDWIRRFGGGRGPGWTPDLTGRRLIRWINHSELLLNKRSPERDRAFLRSLGRQTAFLGRRWRGAPPGLPRFEALTGLLCAGLVLRGMDRHIDPAVQALGRECGARIDSGGGVPSRNPEELMEIFSLLTWTAGALDDVDLAPARPHAAAIERMAPTLRALRHSDGSLARFHGGGRGIEGRLDRSLAATRVKTTADEELVMGYARLRSGRTSVIADAASPPEGVMSHNAHASTLAFELTSGRRQVIVNCGSGNPFGEDLARTGRATPSHSTLSIEGFSSSELGPKQRINGIGRQLLLDAPKDVRCRRDADENGTQLLISHDGWTETHGLTHTRRLDLSHDGRKLSGTDTLGAPTLDAQLRLDRYLERFQIKTVSFQINFHIHPDVDVESGPDGATVSLGLKSGEIWVFDRSDGDRVELESSIYLEKGWLEPRPGRRIVIASALSSHAAQVHWTIAKTRDTPTVVRDYQRETKVPR